jgi:hypothetical protein
MSGHLYEMFFRNIKCGKTFDIRCHPGHSERKKYFHINVEHKEIFIIFVYYEIHIYSPS